MLIGVLFVKKSDTKFSGTMQKKKSLKYLNMITFQYFKIRQVLSSMWDNS